MHVLIAGAGWAGLACAIALVKAGHQVTLWEASRQLGGRARSLDVSMPGGEHVRLDNGQHILIGAYSETLSLMREVGVDVSSSLLRMPLALQFPDGAALRLPDWRKPLIAGLDVAWGVLLARGWSFADKFSLLKTATRWRGQGFACAADISVAQLCQGLAPAVMQMLIEPLCVAALNTPIERASAQVFLRVLRDALLAPTTAGMAASNLLLPRCDLGALFAHVAAAWLAQRSCTIARGRRLMALELLSKTEQSAQILCRDGIGLAQKFESVVLAVPAPEAARLAQALGLADWASMAHGLEHEAIATVYAYAPHARLAAPMLALHSSALQPAQFVFDRGQLTQQPGLLAFVVSACQGDVQTMEQKVIAQGREQLNLPQLQAVRTVIEKRATFACTPGLERPPLRLAAGLYACGDYIQGSYPATLEGAVRSGLAAAQTLLTSLKPS